MSDIDGDTDIGNDDDVTGNGADDGTDIVDDDGTDNVVDGVSISMFITGCDLVRCLSSSLSA